MAVCSPWKVSVRVILAVLVLKALNCSSSSSASHLISSEVGSFGASLLGMGVVQRVLKSTREVHPVQCSIHTAKFSSFF